MIGLTAASGLGDPCTRLGHYLGLFGACWGLGGLEGLHVERGLLLTL